VVKLVPLTPRSRPKRALGILAGRLRVLLDMHVLLWAPPMP
jgi:hypothetical protein